MPNAKVEFEESPQLTAAEVLSTAHRADLEDCIVVGVRNNGLEFMATTMASVPVAIFILQRAIHTLNMIMDELQAEIEDESPPSSDL